jgi:tRNA(Ile)-lysidine synthase
MPEESLLHALKEFIHRHRLIEPGDKLVLAVSGGIDSMTLLDLFHRLKTMYKLDLVVAHCNHQLRGTESELDEQFVRFRAKEYDLETYIELINTKGIAESLHRSIQETARELRYKFLKELRESLGFNNIVTAHQADDNAETILFNFIRGSGVHGLSGIPLRRTDGHIIRPLIFATREEIKQYSQERGLKFREDSSNKKTVYTRNFIRHELFPQIRENINPNITATINRSAEIFQALEEFLAGEIDKTLPAIVIDKSEHILRLDRDRILAHPAFLMEYLLKRAVEEFTPGDLDFSTVKSLVGILNAETGSYYPLPGSVIFYRDRNCIIAKKIPPKSDFTYSIMPDQMYKFDSFEFRIERVLTAELANNPNIEFIDADKLGKNLTIRNWKHGDWFFPFGMKQRKKLSDFFIDAKIPLFEKESIAIVESDNDIVWICGYRLDNRYKITPATKNIIKMEYQIRLH